MLFIFSSNKSFSVRYMFMINFLQKIQTNSVRELPSSQTYSLSTHTGCATPITTGGTAPPPTWPSSIVRRDGRVVEQQMVWDAATLLIHVL